MKILSLIIVNMLLSATAFAEPVIDVTKIAGKTQTEVAKILGNPASCSKNK